MPSVKTKRDSRQISDVVVIDFVFERRKQNHLTVGIRLFGHAADIHTVTVREHDVTEQNLRRETFKRTSNGWSDGTTMSGSSLDILRSAPSIVMVTKPVISLTR